VTCNTASMLLFVGMDPTSYWCRSVGVLLLFACSFTSFYLSLCLYIHFLASLFWCGDPSCRIPFYYSSYSHHSRLSLPFIPSLPHLLETI
jgi:hypothetical protein